MNGLKNTLYFYPEMTAKKLRRWDKKGGPERKAGGGMKQYDDVDEKLFEYIFTCNANNSLSLTNIQSKAKEFSKELKKEIKATQSWLTKFRKRFEERYQYSLDILLAKNKGKK